MNPGDAAFEAESRWEVLPASQESAAPVAYPPPAASSTDGVTLVGKARKHGSSRRFRVGYAVAVLIVAAIVVYVYKELGWLSLTVAACVVILMIRFGPEKPTPPVFWAAPRVDVNDEGISARDVAGITHSSPWSELTTLKMNWRMSDCGYETHLWWADGTEFVDVNLGNSLNEGRL